MQWTYFILQSRGYPQYSTRSANLGTFWDAMSIPRFAEAGELPAGDVRQLISDRLRQERKRLGLTQAALAAQCGVSTRTYKRFELNQCDSLEVFLQVVIGFKRVAAFDLLFPAQEVQVTIRTPMAALERLQARRGQ